MFNNVTLIGPIAHDPEMHYESDGTLYMTLELRIPPPPDLPSTYYRLTFESEVDLGEWPGGDELFIIVCRELPLIELTQEHLKMGDLVCVTGRLVLTSCRIGHFGGQLPEILARELLLLETRASEAN